MRLPARWPLTMETSTKPGARICSEQQPMKVAVMAASARRRPKRGRSCSQRSKRDDSPRTNGTGGRTEVRLRAGAGLLPCHRCCSCRWGLGCDCPDCPDCSAAQSCCTLSAGRSTSAAALAWGTPSASPSSLPLLPPPPNLPLGSCKASAAALGSGCARRRQRRTWPSSSSGAVWQSSSTASPMRLTTTTRRSAGTGGVETTCAGGHVSGACRLAARHRAAAAAVVAAAAARARVRRWRDQGHRRTCA